MIASIWCQTTDGIIGKDGGIPWKYPTDLQRFKRLTMGGSIIMGRHTWESIGRPLPGRNNIVVSKKFLETGPPHADVHVAGSIEEAYEDAVLMTSDVWFVGGRRIYEAAMKYVNVIDVGVVPEKVSGNVVRAPSIDSDVFVNSELKIDEDDRRILRCFFLRKTLKEAPFEEGANRRLQELGYLSRTP